MAQQILVFNDEPHVTRAISLKFIRAGFDVKSVTDIESCWRYLENHEKPALLIVDFSKPYSSEAVDLVRRIRADLRISELPIIVLTSDAAEMIAHSDLLRSLDVAQVFSKPFSPREVLEKTMQILGRSPATPHSILRDKTRSLA